MPDRRCPSCDRWRGDDGRPCPFCGAMKPVCEGCRRSFTFWTELTQDEQLWLCQDCRLERLRMRDSKPHYQCTIAGCSLTAGQHIEAFRAIVSSGAWATRFTTQRPARIHDAP